MPSTIQMLKTALGAGARPSKYLVRFAQPNVVTSYSNLANVQFLCKAAVFPGKTIGQLEYWIQGRKLIIPGDTSFGNTWTLSFYMTEDHDLRRNFISWMQACDNFQANRHSGNPAEIMTEMGVAQLDSAGNQTSIYTFHNVFPQDIGEVSVGSDQQDTAMEFDVTFSYTDWVVGTEAEDKPGSANAATKNSTAY